MKKFSLLLSVLFVAGTAYGQGTQISGSQIKDGAITNAKIKSDAAILYSKLDFTGAPASIINAENPLTFSTPLSRSGNTVSITIIPVTSAGTGLTSVAAGRLLFGGNSTTLGTSANLAFDSGTSAFTVTGTGHFTSALTVGGTTTFNTKAYTWPASYGAAGSVLTDVAGNGTISWQPTASAGVTLQLSDPGTPDTGGLNITGKGFFGNYVHMKGSPIYFQTDGNDLNDYIKWSSTADTMQMFGWNGTDLGASSTGTTAALSVRQINEAASQLIIAASPFSTVTAGNVNAAGLPAPGVPTITNIGTAGSTSWTYLIGAVLADGSVAPGSPDFTGTGHATLDGTNFNHLVWSPIAGAYAYNIYRTFSGGTPASGGLIASNIKVLLYDDQGAAGDNNPIPTNNTGVVKGKYHTTTLGAGVATAATVVPTGSVFHITDAATPIDTITLPYTGFVGAITLLPDAVFTTTNSGNIILGSTAVIGKALIMTYDGTKWYPSY